MFVFESELQVSCPTNSSPADAFFSSFLSFAVEKTDDQDEDEQLKNNTSLLKTTATSSSS